MFLLRRLKKKLKINGLLVPFLIMINLTSGLTIVIGMQCYRERVNTLLFKNINSIILRENEYSLCYKSNVIIMNIVFIK